MATEVRPLRAHDIPAGKPSRAKADLARIILALRDFSGLMPCSEWEQTYPEFVDWTREQLIGEFEVRRTHAQLEVY